MIRILLIACLFLLGAAPSQSHAQKLYYNIAHAINHTQFIDWAVRNGANGIEADLNFHSDGSLQDFQHRTACECQFWNSADNCKEFKRNNVYRYDSASSQLTYIRGNADACNLAESARSFLNNLARQTSIALFIVDSKVKRSAKKNEAAAGTNVIRALDAELFGKGYRGKVIVGVASSGEQAYLRAAAEAAKTSPYADRIYFSLDQDGDGTDRAWATVDLLRRIAGDRGVYGNGVSSVFVGSYDKEMQIGVLSEVLGYTRLTYVWTLESESPMRRYLGIGVRGIMTNNPATLNAVLQPYFARGDRLARPEDPLL